jgi:hypothetical protein
MSPLGKTIVVASLAGLLSGAIGGYLATRSAKEVPSPATSITRTAASLPHSSFRSSLPTRWSEKDGFSYSLDARVQENADPQQCFTGSDYQFSIAVQGGTPTYSLIMHSYHESRNPISSVYLKDRDADGTIDSCRVIDEIHATEVRIERPFAGAPFTVEGMSEHDGRALYSLLSQQYAQFMDENDIHEKIKAYTARFELRLITVEPAK